MASDGSVEIRITGAVDSSLAASASEAKAEVTGLGDAATVSASKMAAALQAAGGDLSKVTPAMLGLAAASKGAAIGQEALGVAAKGSAAATATETVAAELNTAAHVNSRAATEALVLVHEALQGRYTRMAGSSMILTQALAGQGAASGVLAAAMTAEGAIAVGTAVAFGAVAVAAGVMAYREYEAQKAATAMNEAFALTGRASSTTVDAIRAEVDQLGQMDGVSHKAAQALVEFDAAHADVNGRISEGVNQLAPLFVKAWGKDGVEALNHLKEALAGVEHATREQAVKEFEHLNQTMLNLKPGEAQIIEGMIEIGDQIGAVDRIMADLAANGGGSLKSLDREIVETQKELQDAKNDVAALKAEAASEVSPRALLAIKEAASVADARVAQLSDRLRQMKGEAASPAHGEDPADAYAKSHATLLSLRDSATRARDALKELHDEMATRRAANPQDKEVADYYAHQAKYDHDLLHKEDPGDFKKPKTRRAKKGPSIVQEWTEQLHAAEIQSNDFFADQTDAELKFWEGKVGLTKQGSKEWLEVQSRIYEARKTLAHQDYDEHIADLNDQLQADRDNWTAEEADWQKKLDFIKRKHKEESTEYKNAYREFLAAEREHQQQMLQAQHDGEQKQLQSLRAHLQAEQQIRQTMAGAAEAVIKAQSDGQILGEVSAATKIAQLHRQLAAQEIADAETAYKKEDSLLQEAIDTARAKYTEDSRQYKDAVNAKTAADKQYYDQKRQLEAKDYAQQIADLQQLKTAYHSYIDGTVSATVSGLGQMITGQETWKQAILGILQSIEQTFETVIERIIENWIVNLLVGKAQTSATAVAQVTSYAGVAGAAGVASWAGAPWPIDAGAPEFGASMAAAAQAFAPMASLAVGTNELPRDMIVQAHEGERVIPKADNRKLIQILEASSGVAAQSGGSGDGSSSGGGGVHLHLHGNIIHNPRQLEAWFRANASAVGAGVLQHARNGGVQRNPVSNAMRLQNA